MHVWYLHEKWFPIWWAYGGLMVRVTYALRLTWQILCLGKQTMISKTKWGVWAFTVTQQSEKKAMTRMFKKLLLRVWQEWPPCVPVHFPVMEVSPAQHTTKQFTHVMGHDAPNTCLKQANTRSPTWRDYWRAKEDSAPWRQSQSDAGREGRGTQLHSRMTSMTRWRRKVRLLWRAPNRFRSSSQTLSEG